MYNGNLPANCPQISSNPDSGVPTLEFLGFLSIYAYTVCHRTTKFEVITHLGEGHVSSGQPRLPSQESGVPGLPNFCVFAVFMPTPFNAQSDQIPRSNTYMEGMDGRVFRRSGTSLHLHKCVLYLFVTQYSYYLSRRGRYCLCVKDNGKIVHGFGLYFQDQLTVSSFEIDYRRDTF